jgi:hypothetical protein
MSQVYEYRLIERLADRIAERVAARLEGRVTVVSPEAEAIAKAIRKELGRIRISIDYKLIIQTLMELELAQPATNNNYYWLGPNEVVKFEIVVPRGMVALLMQTRFVCDPDHALAVYVYTDGKLMFWDEDMVQARYIHPLTFMEIGSLVISREKGEFIVRNKTSSTAYFSHQTILGHTDAETWNAVIKALSNVVAEELNLPLVLRRTG